MNAIFWLHVGQSGKNGGTVFEDMLGMSALLIPGLRGSLSQRPYGENVAARVTKVQNRPLLNSH
jgi:hypothetical protein